MEDGTEVINATVASGASYLRVGSRNIGVANPRVITLRRTSQNAAIYATINTDRGSARAYLPPRPEPVARPSPQPIVIRAVDYLPSGSQGIARTTAPGNPNWEWGEGIGNGGPPWDAPRPNRAAYAVNAPRAGAYSLSVEYAAGESRPVDIYVNGTLEKQGALAGTTGGFCLNPTRTNYCTVSNARWSEVGTVDLRAGTNELVITRSSVFPHIKTIRLSYVVQQ